MIARLVAFLRSLLGTRDAVVVPLELRRSVPPPLPDPPTPTPPPMPQEAPAVKLSLHFDTYEFGLSARVRKGVRWGPVEYPDEWIEGRLRPLVAALEVLRAKLGGRSITVTSGFRPRPYNRAIGSSDGSQHVQGRAADIVVAGVPAAQVHEVALRLATSGEIVIGGLGAYTTFTHIDVRPEGSGLEASQPGQRLARWVGARRDS